MIFLFLRFSKYVFHIYILCFHRMVHCTAKESPDDLSGDSCYVLLLFKSLVRLRFCAVTRLPVHSNTSVSSSVRSSVICVQTFRNVSSGTPCTVLFMPRMLTETVPSSASLSPTTTMYGSL